MKSIGFSIIILLILIPILAISQEKKEEKYSVENTISIEKIDRMTSHQRMLKKLQIKTDEDKESYARRAEVVFFIAFGYIWMYQFIMYNQLLPSVFSEGGDVEELSRDRNLFFAIVTSIILALFVSRNDLQHYNYIKRGRFYTYPGVEDRTFKRREKSYNWYFNFFAWEF